MKKEIHPEYFTQASVKCACGNEFKIGSTLKEIQTEICHNCHPFYTGQEKVLDTAGRVEKFKAKRAAAKPQPVKKIKTKQKEEQGSDSEEVRAVEQA